MSQDEMDDLYEGEEEVDNASALTSGLVIVTTVLLLIALITMFKALGSKYQVGPMKGDKTASSTN